MTEAALLPLFVRVLFDLRFSSYWEFQCSHGSVDVVEEEEEEVLCSLILYCTISLLA